MWKNKIIELTYEEYQTLETIDPDTEYHIIDAQSAIDKLNGYEYRGRKLAVSYSRQKTEDEIADEKAEAKAESAFASETAITEADMAAEDAAAYAAAEKAAADQTPFGSN